MPNDRPKGILFTHVAANLDQARSIYRKSEDANAFVEEHVPFFSSCLECGELIRLVYVYVDLCLRDLKKDPGGKGFSIFETTAALEGAVIGSLKKAEKRARRRVPAGEPRFEYVGISQLASLLTALIDIDPDLMRPIAGPGVRFTYDSPKFIEAVIRLARGVDPSLCRQPIFRIDADVLPNPQAIGALLERAHEELREGGKYFFFSGGYFGKGGKESLDPVNQHAVRTHWLFDNGEGSDAFAGCNRFLGDLGVIGATQLTLDSDWGFLPADADGVPRSEEGQRLAASVAPRPSPQVISGAGLVMSFCCILELPPFLNADNMVVWIDDHLKRLLHEALDHVGRSQTEALPQARFRQDRKVAQPWAQKARKVYFERLFRGCLMHALIISDSGLPGVLATWVDRAVRGQVRRAEPSEDGEELFDRTSKTTCDKMAIIAEMVESARAQGEKVLKLWRESRQAYQDPCLADWAERPVHGPETGDETPLDLEDVYRSTAEDAYRYIVLVTEWWDYVRAILRLDSRSAGWLFE
jgi:hypothetical protein